MSRSKRKPIVKDKPSVGKRKYHRKIRRVTKSKVKSIEEDDILPLPQDLINDWNYCDWFIDFRNNAKYKKKYSRK